MKDNTYENNDEYISGTKKVKSYIVNGSGVVIIVTYEDEEN